MAVLRKLEINSRSLNDCLDAARVRYVVVVFLSDADTYGRSRHSRVALSGIDRVYAMFAGGKWPVPA